MRNPRNYLLASFWTALSSLLLLSLFWIGHAAFRSESVAAGAPPKLLSHETRDDLQRTFRNAILDAKKSVWLSVYTLTDPGIVRAIKIKAEEGIDVRVISDAKASASLSKTLGKKVKLTLRRGKGLMHHKILVIDESKIWIGSANMTPSSLKMHGNLVLGAESLELAKGIIGKLAMLSKTGRIEPVWAQDATISGQKLEMWFLPDNQHAEEKVKALIRSAEKTIKVAMFTWTHFDFAKEIAEAKARGVQAEIVLDKNASVSTNAKIVNELIRSKIPLRISSGPGLLHHKMMIIDDKILLTGSANWTYSAFQKNEDYFAVLYHLTDEQRDFLQKMWNEILRDSAPVEESASSPIDSPDSFR